MQPIVRLSASLALVALAGCASAKITARSSNVREGERLARPDRIIVHDFAASSADLPAEWAAAGRYGEHTMPQTDEEIAVGRRLGAQVAAELVSEIEAMGLDAVRAAGQPQPRIGDVVLRGYFESIDEGSATKRIVLGFGSGTADLRTVVEGYQMTDRGLRLLGSGAIDSSGGGKTPGVIVPIAVVAATANPIGLAVGGAIKATGELTGHDTIEGAAKRTAKAIADELRVRFEQQGWI